jgi:hypothetical protein
MLALLVTIAGFIAWDLAVDQAQGGDWTLARFLDDAGRARGKALLDKLAKHPDKSVVDAVSYSKAVLASLVKAMP